jgi:hypothetical protein
LFLAKPASFFSSRIGPVPLDEPFRAFPSWFLRIECDRCGKDRFLNEGHTGERRGTMALRVLPARMRHDGCGGRAGRVELLTGVTAVTGLADALSSSSSAKAA